MLRLVVADKQADKQMGMLQATRYTVIYCRPWTGRYIR